MRVKLDGKFFSKKPIMGLLAWPKGRVMESINDTFTICGKKFEFDFIAGEVIETKLHSETHISGHGGGGHISTSAFDGVTGHISPVQINSRVDTKTVLWVKTPKGVEDEWKIPIEVSARSGHKLLMMTIRSVENRDNFMTTLVNTSINKIQQISSAKELSDMFNLTKKRTHFGWLGLVGAPLMALIFGASGGGGAGVFGFFLPIGLAIFLGSSNKKSITQDNAEVISLFNNIIKKGNSLIPEIAEQSWKS